jgi:hypothetical protein
MADLANGLATDAGWWWRETEMLVGVDSRKNEHLDLVGVGHSQTFG